MMLNSFTRSLKVLILDDDEADVHLLERQLAKIEDYDFTTFAAKDGEEAIAICGYEDVDVVFSDYALAEGSCVEFVRDLRQLKSSVPIILVSGMPGRSVRLEGYPAGAKAFVSKDDLSPTTIESAIAQDRFYDLCAVVSEFVDTLDGDAKNVPESLKKDIDDLRMLMIELSQQVGREHEEINSDATQEITIADEKTVVRVLQNMCHYFFQEGNSDLPVIETHSENGLFFIEILVPQQFTAASHADGMTTLNDTAIKLGGSLDVKSDLSGIRLTITLPVQNTH